MQPGEMHPDCFLLLRNRTICPYFTVTFTVTTFVEAAA